MLEGSFKDMEVERTRVNQIPSIVPRIFPAVGPVLLISVGYVDPGKWAAAVEGGAHFGFDLVFPLLVFSLTAILCQYLAACIGVVTGKNLAQICREEYNKFTCILLGVQAEISMMTLDLTMILGVSHALNLLFGVDLFTCVLLASVDAVLFPFFTSSLEKFKTEALFMGIAGFILLCYFFGVLISQPEVTLVTNAMLTKLSGESAFTLMSILGANIMPHNFYLHSSAVQRNQGRNGSMSALCHDHLFAILCIFSCIFLVNYVLMSSAATLFHSSGLVVLTFQDALLPMDQVFRSSIALFAFFLLMIFSSQITALSWNLGGQVALRDLFRMDPPIWLHRITIRLLTLVPALYYAWSSGAEGIYQLLIFVQVILAMLLPSSVIPLFRVASSRAIMGNFKISQFVEFLALTTFIGMLGLKIIFVVEMLFGNSDWVDNLRLGSSITLAYVVLLVTACVSFCFMLWLLATPLNSATVRVDAQIWKDLAETKYEPSAEIEESSKTKYHEEEPVAEEPVLEGSLESCSNGSVVEFDLDLPETSIDSDQELPLTFIEKNCPPAITESKTHHPEESAPTVVFTPVANVGNEVSNCGSLDSSILQKIESVEPCLKIGSIERDSQTEKDDEDTASTSDGPGSVRSPSGKSDDGGNGSASLTRLSGLGRAARRNFAAILEEFWSQLYDLHGNTIKEAKIKKLNVLLGVEPISLQVDSSGAEPYGYPPIGYPPIGGERVSAFPSNPSLYSPKQQRMASNIDSSYGFQTRPCSSWSSRTQLLDAYVRSCSGSVLESGEKRYSSLHLPPSSDGWDNQPVTVHGYQMASYLGRNATDRTADSSNFRFDSQIPKSPSLLSTNYRDSLAYILGQNAQNGISSICTSGMQNPVVSRNIRLQEEEPYFDPCSSGLGENVGSSAYTKKYHSLPSISGLTVPNRDSCLSDKIAQCTFPIGFGTSLGRATYGPSLYSNTKSRTGVPLAFDEFSPSKFYKNAASIPLGSNSDATSFWSRQPNEQLFGASGIPHSLGDGVTRSSLLPEATVEDLEVKMLQSFRYCIGKLLKLEGSDWLFRKQGGADEDLIDQVAASELFHYEIETKEVTRVGHMRNDANCQVSSVPHCVEGCIWKLDLIVSFGVWCIHRILELSLMESRPELWGKYTYVLNRLQGILEPAFSKPRSPPSPCFCVHIPLRHVTGSSQPLANKILTVARKPGSVKCTSTTMLLDLIKEVETAVSGRKGRTGTVAGEVAYPKGKENLASVLKRYKRRLSNKSVGSHEGGSGSRKFPMPSTYAL